MVTPVSDGSNSDAECQRGDASRLGLSQHLARAVDDLTAAVGDLRGPDHSTGAVTRRGGATEYMDPGRW
jgi:hypothetical protein